MIIPWIVIKLEGDGIHMWFLKSQISNMHIVSFDDVIPKTYFVKYVSNNNIEFLQNKHESIK
jgi:hypothetical protein